jgi:hypothetical protein
MVFALHAGAAIEHLSKALLASKHPALISADDYESLLHATGQDAYAARPVMRTIGVTESVRRCSRFVPQLSNLDSELRILCDARNGVAHLAQLPDIDNLRVPFLKACELIRADLALDRKAYWEEFEGAVDAALEQHVHDAAVRAETAIATARIELKSRYGHLTESTRQAVIQSITRSHKPRKYDDEIIECPACDQPAIVSGVTETRWEQDEEFSASFLGSFYPGYFRCAVCDLELDGEDELKAADIPEEWEIEVDAADFYDE